MSDPLGLETSDPLGLGGDDPLGLGGEPDEPMGTFHPMEEAGRAIMENTKGAITAAGDLAAAIPGMIGAAPYGLIEAAKNGPKAGLQAFGEVSHAMNPLTEDFQYGPLPGVKALTPDRDTGAYHNLNKPFEMMSQGWGNIAAIPPEIAGADQETIDQWGSAGELGFGTLGALAGAKGGVDAYKGVKGRFDARKAQTQTAQDMLQQKMAGEAEYGSWEAYDAERQAYMKAMEELDNSVIKYKKDLQAPQLGGGGKVARIPDQVGKREQGKYASQSMFDEDMHKLGEDYQGVRNEAHEAALAKGEDQLGQYTPASEGDIREHAPKPVRPYQVEQLREGRISEGEATRIYLKPAFQRTLEEKMKLRDYESKLRQAKGPDATDISSDAVKEPGGNWHSGAHDDLVQGLMGHNVDIIPRIDMGPREGRWFDWVNKNVKRYLERYAGTTRDPLKDIEIPYLDGTARWEDITDTLIASRKVQNYPGWDDPRSIFKNLQPDTPIWDFGRNSGRVGPLRDPAQAREGFPEGPERMHTDSATRALQEFLTHVRDYATGNVRGEHLDRYDFIRMIKETAEWDKKLAKSMEKQQLDSMKDATVHKAYPDGFKWIKLDKPGQFAAESDMMGHSVRGYEPYPTPNNPVPNGGHPEYGLGGWDAIKRGDAEIYSLRDKQGRAHVTIEVKAPVSRTAAELMKDIDPSFNAQFKPSIIQIKGKQNRAPTKEYLPYVQDFVKSRQWGDVGDLHNTGMNTPGGWARDTLGLEYDDLHPDLYNKYANARNDVFLTKEEFNKELQQRYQPDWSVMQDGNFETFSIYDKQGRRVSPTFKDIEQAKDWLQDAKHIALGPSDPRSSGLTGEGDYNGALFQYQSLPADKFIGRAAPTVRGMVKLIGHTSKNPFFRELSKLLLNDKDWNPRFEWRENLIENGQRFSGQFRSSTYKISMLPTLMGREKTLMHEIMHSRTQAAIGLYEHNPERYSKFATPIKHLQDLLSHTKTEWEKSYPGEKQAYGLTNIHEFISEAFSNSHFQNFLNRVEWKNTIYPRGKTVWEGFVNAIRQIFRLNDDRHTALSEALKAGADLATIADKDTRLQYAKWWQQGALKGGDTPPPMSSDNPARWMQDNYGAPYEYNDFKKDLEAKGIRLPEKQLKAMYAQQTPASKPNIAHPESKAVQAVQDIPALQDIQKHYADKRTWEEVLPEIQKAKDVSLFKANVTAKMIQGKFTALEHPLWSWTSSQIHWIKNDALRMANEKLHGRDRQSPQEGTYNHMWKLLSGKERREVNKLGWEFNNRDGQISLSDMQQWAAKELGHELTPRQIKAYQDRVRINKEVLTEINKMLVANKKEPIHELPNYWSPNVFRGPYLTKFIDPKTGETVRIEDSYNRPNTAKMQKQFPEYKVETTEIATKGGMDFEQIEWILRHLHKQMRDPAARAIAEGLRRQGFMKHGLKRRGVKGGAGSGDTMKSLREYEETSEQYIRNAYEYMANRKLDSLFNKVLDEKSIDGQPHAKGYALEAIDSARGGAHHAFEDFSRVLSNIFRGSVQISTLGALKLPERALKDFIKVNSRIGTALLLGFGNLTNIAAQLLQASTYMPPKLMAEYAKAGRNPALAFKAMSKAYAELRHWDSSPDIQKLKEVGALDPTFKYDWSTYASESDPRFKQRLADHMTGVSLLSWLESNAVRRPASLMFLHMLKELGYKGDDIHYVAKEMTDHYMVSTKWYEKPHMFSRTGVVGQTLSPLQSFTTTWAGMLREYSKLSAQGLLEGSIAKQMPLASFMAVNLLTAGMLGLVGVKEWDAIATWLNKQFGYNVPTGTEFIMSHFKSNKLRFGVLSDAIGMHIGATFNAPSLTGSFGLPLQNIYNAGRAVVRGGQWLGSQLGLNNPPDSAQMREAAKGVTPRFSPVPGLNWGDIEKQATPEGLPYQDAAGNAGPVTRDDKDWLARRLGTYTTKEATEKNRNYVMKQEAEQRSSKLSGVMSKAIDQMLMGDRANASKMLQELARTGQYSSSDIKNGLKREVLSKIIESDTRMMGKGQTMKQQQLIRLYQELQ